jgi:uridylate kinase
MSSVISVGGSIVAPDKVDEAYLKKFVRLIVELLIADEGRRFILVVGGGGPARSWQAAYRSVSRALGVDEDNDEADWIGIMATRLNARLLKALFGAYCADDVVTDPTAFMDEAGGADRLFTGRVLVAAGWKPGFSSDNDAVLLARRFGAGTVINLSNIEAVYTADPGTDPGAKPLSSIGWKDFRLLTGNDWTPGKNVPFDPVASGNAEKFGIEVICAAGANLENLRQILCGGPYTGTLIHG